MNDETTLFAESISDEGAFALSEALHWLALACEEKYIGQILRHMKTMDKTRLGDSEQPWLRNSSPK